MRKYRHVVAAVLGTEWALEQSRLDAVCEILTIRARGDRLTREAVAHRVAAGRATMPARDNTPQVGSQIAVLNLFGICAPRVSAMEAMSSEALDLSAVAAAFRAAVADPAVRAIVLNIDSPGGAVMGVGELAQEIFAARAHKPIIAVANHLAASGAFWLFSAASERVISPSAQVGSVGVFGVHRDESVKDAKAGVTYTYVSAGPYKTETMDGPLSEAARTALQTRIDAYYRMFVESLAQNFGLPVAHVIERFGGGRAMMAGPAVAAGMGDRVATLEQVLGELLAAPSGAAGGPVNVAHGAPDFQGGSNVKLHTLMVRLGLVDVSAAAERVRIAAELFLSSRGLDSAGTDDELAGRIEALGLIQTPAPLTALVPAQGAQPPAPPASPPPPAAASAADATLMILRAARLARLGNAADLATELGAQIAGRALTIEQALDRVEAAAVAARPAVGVPPISFGPSADENFRQLASEALVHRYTPGREDGRAENFRPSQAALEERRLQSIDGCCQEILLRSGVDARTVMGVDRSTMARMFLSGRPVHGLAISAEAAYNASGQFSDILYDATNVTARRGWDEAERTYTDWMQRGDDIENFKEVYRIIGGELPDPQAIPENGEFEQATTVDGREHYRLYVWGNMFSLTWQMWVNDQLGEFMKVQRRQMKAMGRKVNKLAYNTLRNNPTLSDSVALFHASHGNVGTSAVVSESSFLEAYRGMRAQTGINTAAAPRVAIRPKYLIYSPWNIQNVEKILTSSASVAASGNSGITNVWKNRFQPVEEAELFDSVGSFTQYSWVLAADGDTIEYAYMRGMETPVIDPPFRPYDQLALSFRNYFCFGSGALDFRGLYFNAGAAS